MGIRGGLRNRDRQPELMDQPGLDEDEHRHALSALGRINRVSGTARVLWPWIREECTRRLGLGEKKVIRLLDIATGGGDLPVRLWKKARRAGLDLEVAGCDRSEQALSIARERARHARADVRFFPQDATGSPLSPGYDILISSLFLHHLDEPEALGFLRSLRAADALVLIDDLERGPAGWLLAQAGVRLLSRSRLARVDGPRSVRAAFTSDEALELAREAGWQRAEVRRHWPCRFLLIGRPS